MTTKEAIQILKQYLDMDSEVKSEYLEAQRMAIKALEQQPCEDCISRKKVISEIDKYIEKVQSAGSKDDFISFQELVVKQLPSVTPKAEWIPVSERLPERDEEYHTFLVTDSKGRVTLSEFYLSISDRKPYWSGMVDVIAWMPLPEPYKIPAQTFGCAED